MLRWMAAVLISFGLYGCGQKGDLYLPPLPGQQKTEQQKAEPEQAEQSQAGQPNSEPATLAQP